MRDDRERRASRSTRQDLYSLERTWRAAHLTLAFLTERPLNCTESPCHQHETELEIQRSDPGSRGRRLLAPLRYSDAFGRSAERVQARGRLTERGAYRQPHTVTCWVSPSTGMSAGTSDSRASGNVTRATDPGPPREMPRSTEVVHWEFAAARAADRRRPTFRGSGRHAG